MNRGEILYDYDPLKEKIYALMTQYFDNPVMTKMRDVNNFSMYMTRIHTLLGIEFRYIIVFVAKNNEAVGHKERMQNLYWTCLQTLSLDIEHSNLPFHSYRPQRLQELDKDIKLIQKDDKQYVYSVAGLPMKITLLPNGKSEYMPSGKVVNALETYQTIVTLV